MANSLSLNVYEVDGRPITVAKRVFIVSNISLIRPYDGGNSTVLYSIIKDRSTKQEYAVVETTTALQSSIG